jgi:3-hydroxyacyl-[acyl-carrier-protein] dehydratase
VNSKRSLRIALDHPAFAGHFPGMPILPGVVLLDEALRAIEVDLDLDLRQWQIAAAKFLEFVRPGEALTIEHTSPESGLIRFTVRVADRPALTGTLSLAPAGGA